MDCPEPSDCMLRTASPIMYPMAYAPAYAAYATAMPHGPHLIIWAAPSYARHALYASLA